MPEVPNFIAWAAIVATLVSVPAAFVSVGFNIRQWHRREVDDSDLEIWYPLGIIWQTLYVAV